MPTSVPDPANILIIRPSALGDVCRTVPVLASLKRRFPEAHIDWLVQDTFVPAIEHHPDLHEAIPFPRADVAVHRLWRSGSARATLRNLARSLRRRSYDLVLDCQGLGRSGWFAWKTGAPVRIGFRQARELGWLGLTRRISAPRTLHTVDRMLALTRAAGAEPLADMRLYTSDADRAAAAELVPSENTVVIAPTSRWQGKRWPANRFATCISRMFDENLTDTIVIVGGKDERDQCTAALDLAATDSRIINLVGATSIGALMAIIERAALVIANDSAALHMAVGFDRPLVALFGPTRIDLVGPYQREHDVLQHVTPPARNRHKDAAFGITAMHTITVDEVVSAAAERVTPLNPAHAHGAQER